MGALDSGAGPTAEDGPSVEMRFPPQFPPREKAGRKKAGLCRALNESEHTNISLRREPWYHRSCYWSVRYVQTTVNGGQGPAQLLTKDGLTREVTPVTHSAVLQTKASVPPDSCAEALTSGSLCRMVAGFGGGGKK